MSLKDAFNYALSIHRRKCTLTRISGTDGVSDTVMEIHITPSNYFRNLEGPSNTTIEGREFVVSKDVFLSSEISSFKRGDRITDDDLGDMAVDTIKELYDIGGSIIGWRITTR